MSTETIKLSISGGSYITHLIAFHKKEQRSAELLTKKPHGVTCST